MIWEGKKPKMVINVNFPNIQFDIINKINKEKI